MALGKYEVVVLFDSNVSEEDLNKLKTKVEDLIKSLNGKILDIDDIGYLETLFKIGPSDKPYFYSLYVDLEKDSIKGLKRELGIMGEIVRYKVFKMKNNQKFLKFKDIEKELKEIDFSDLQKSGIFNEMKS